jgi:hypothetical protein
MLKIKLCVSVTAEHIGKGTRGKCGSCPLALALQETLKGTGAERIFVGNRTFQFALNKEIRSFVMPVKAQKFVYEFDKTRPVKPFKFSFELSQESLKESRDCNV